jgi:F0F1-type ATP synthase gamma subunit
MRQASITQELIEIVNGAQALQDSWWTEVK